MKKSGKFITALLLSSALICAAIPSQSLQAQTVTITKEAISDDLYCVTELVFQLPRPKAEAKPCVMKTLPALLYGM